jgi:hypothetical protein
VLLGCAEANKFRLIDQNAPDDRVFSKQAYSSSGASSLLVWAARNASQVKASPLPLLRSQQGLWNAMQNNAILTFSKRN